MALQHFCLYSSSTVPCIYIQSILLYGSDSETWALARALEGRIPAFDNICLRRIFYEFPTQTMLPMLTYDSETVSLHRSCCRSSKQDSAVIAHVARMGDSHELHLRCASCTTNLKLICHFVLGFSRHWGVLYGRPLRAPSCSVCMRLLNFLIQIIITAHLHHHVGLIRH